jgi:hypothetical protein
MDGNAPDTNPKGIEQAIDTGKKGDCKKRGKDERPVMDAKREEKAAMQGLQSSRGMPHKRRS